jgi:hypothetical protein
MSNIEWTQIEQEIAVKWRSIFHKSKIGINVDGDCPICNKATLHRWYLVGRPIEQIIEGNKFVAQGDLWEWCSSCKVFEHYSSLVPDWWKCDLEVNLKELRFTPNVIEGARRKKFG